MSTYNICLHGEMRKISTIFGSASVAQLDAHPTGDQAVAGQPLRGQQHSED